MKLAMIFLSTIACLLAGCARHKDLVLHLDHRQDTGDSIRDQSRWRQDVRQGGARNVRTVLDEERGKVLGFDGDDAYLRVSKTASLKLNDGFTLSVWFRVPLFDRQLPVLEWEGDGWNTHMWLNVMDVQWRGGASGVNLCIQKAGPENIICIDNPDRDRWTHMAITYDPSNHTCSIFLNGELKITRGVPPGLPATGTDLIVGARPAMPGARFKGLMDDLRVYNRPLTADEIKAL
jgi:hypothetical protein